MIQHLIPRLRRLDVRALEVFFLLFHDPLRAFVARRVRSMGLVDLIVERAFTGMRAALPGLPALDMVGLTAWAQEFVQTELDAVAGSAEALGFERDTAISA